MAWCSTGSGWRSASSEVSGLWEMTVSGTKVKAIRTAQPERSTAPQAKARAVPAERHLKELKERLLEASDIGMAAAVLRWDQATHMPAGGAGARGRQTARLSEIAHKKRTDAAIGRLLDKLTQFADALPDDADDARLIRIARRDYDRAVRIPSDVVARWSEASAASYNAWVKARPANDYATMAPHLERALERAHQYAGYFPDHDHVMDPLIGPDEGVTVAETRALFKKLRAELVPLVREIAAQPVTSDVCLRAKFPEREQLDFAIKVAQDMGYDLGRGRLDKTAHPFMTSFSRDDVRITTRVQERDLSDALFSTWHETGHALYELGIAPEIPPPLDDGTSGGVHESQSRLWENIVARSRGFWGHYYPQLQRAFPEQLDAVPLDDFYRAINKVERTLIRTDADEVTYNLHVMIRFDLECQMMEGKLAIKDLPDAWAARYKSDLDIEPPDHSTGVLQDVHWFAGGLGGAFQSYTIGNILSVQFYEAALAAHPEIPAETAAGRFDVLHGWLKEHVYRHGRKFGVHELVKRATGKKMRIEPYMGYLRGKYGALYKLRG